MPPAQGVTPRSPSPPKRKGKKKQSQEATEKEQTAAGKEPQEKEKQGEMRGAARESRKEGGGGSRQQTAEEEKTTAITALGVAAGMAKEAVEATEQLEKQGEELKNEAFDIYNKGLTSQMTFDESGFPILVPLDKSRAVPAPKDRLLPTTTAASDDTEGQYEAVPPPKGPCAGLCPPYGALPEQMPFHGAAGKRKDGSAASKARETGVGGALAAAAAAGDEVREEGGQLYICKKLQRGMSIYTLPSRGGIVAPFPSERSCPVPVWQLLPPSPFINTQGCIGVDVYAITEDLGSPEYRDAIPLYDVGAVSQAAAAAGRHFEPHEEVLMKQKTGDESFFKRLDTLTKSALRPERVALD